MLIEKKDNYILFSSDENSFVDFYNSYTKEKDSYKKHHLIVHISNNFNIKKEDFLLFLDESQLKKENGTSFVIINNKINIDDFPESLNIVPTLTEAEDVLEMEAIERELGF